MKMLQWIRWMVVGGMATLLMSVAPGVEMTSNASDDDPMAELMEEPESETSAEEMSPEAARRNTEKLKGLLGGGPAFRTEDFELQVDENATADELYEELERIGSVQPLREWRTDEEMYEYLELATQSASEVADRLLNAKPTEEQATLATQAFLSLYSIQTSGRIGFLPENVQAFEDKYIVPLSARLRELGFETLAREPERMNILNKFRDVPLPPIDLSRFGIAPQADLEDTETAEDAETTDDIESAENTEDADETETPKVTVAQVREQLSTIVDEAFAFVQDGEKTGIPMSVSDARFLQTAVTNSETLLDIWDDESEQEANDAFLAIAQQRMSDLLGTSEDPGIKTLLAAEEANLRLVKCVGQPFELRGVTLDGEAFDWESYRGRIVLVDFWATWCGPCIAEAENIKAAYEKFHDKGFDVVGISIDSERDDLEKYLQKSQYPWTVLWDEALNEDVEDGEDRTMGTFYGIQAIPTTILVDKDGKAIMVDCRGDMIEKMLSELLGE